MQYLRARTSKEKAHRKDQKRYGNIPKRVRENREERGEKEREREREREITSSVGKYVRGL